MSDMAVEFRHRPITVEEYYRMLESEILRPDERVELIEGDLIAMPPIGPDHEYSTTECGYEFIARLDTCVTVRTQSTLMVSEISAPQPDVLILRGDRKEYKGRHAKPEDVLFLVEIGDTSRMYDRRVKVPLYARAGIPEVWLIDLQDRAINVFRDLRNGDYQTVLTLRPGERIACAAFPDEFFFVDDILG
jgi:hypothetical protein